MKPTTGRLVVEVNEFDVFFGRGKNAFFKSGNVNFRRLVKEKAGKFHNSAQDSTKTRTELARETIAEIAASGGRFLRPVTASSVDGSVCGAWEVVPDEVALMKTKQAMRDAWSPSKSTRKKTGAARDKGQRNCQQPAPSFDQQVFIPPSSPILPFHPNYGIGFPPPTQRELFQHGLLDSGNPFGQPNANSVQNLWLGGATSPRPVGGLPLSQYLCNPGDLLMATQLSLYPYPLLQPADRFLAAPISASAHGAAAPTLSTKVAHEDSHQMEEIQVRQQEPFDDATEDKM